METDHRPAAAPVMLLELDTADRGRDVETGEEYVRHGDVWQPGTLTPALLYERDRAKLAAEVLLAQSPHARMVAVRAITRKP